MVTVGFVRAGALLNTKTPEPVSSDTAEIKLALDGVVKKVATPVPRPDTPVLIGKPVALVKVPLDGVPRAPPLTTGAPAEPTATANAVATPVPNPDTPVLIGKPVALVNVADVGVPKTGVTKVGLVVSATVVPEPLVLYEVPQAEPVELGMPAPG